MRRGEPGGDLRKDIEKEYWISNLDTCVPFKEWFRDQPVTCKRQDNGLEGVIAHCLDACRATGWGQHAVAQACASLGQ